MSIPAAESWDVMREAALTFRQWWQQHFARDAGKPGAPVERKLRRENVPAAIRSPFAPRAPFSDTIQTRGLDGSEDPRAR
jgi:hypothetical protein